MAETTIANTRLTAMTVTNLRSINALLFFPCAPSCPLPSHSPLRRQHHYLGSSANHVPMAIAGAYGMDFIGPPDAGVRVQRLRAAAMAMHSAAKIPPNAAVHSAAGST